MGHDLDDALRFQELKSFAQRDPADAQPRSDIGLDQPLAGLDGTAGDGVGQRVGDPQRQAWGGDRRHQDGLGGELRGDGHLILN